MTCKNCNNESISDEAIFFPHYGIKFPNLESDNIDENVFDLRPTSWQRRLLGFIIDGYPFTYAFVVCTDPYKHFYVMGKLR